MDELEDRQKRISEGEKLDLISFVQSLSFTEAFNLCVLLVFTICYAYQMFYILVALIKKPKKHIANTEHRYAVLVSARNESAVIGDLLSSISNQDYPEELIDVFVIADNCTDDTANVAKEHGARVFVREDTVHVGKGYALDYALNRIWDEYGKGVYEAFFVFDADNVLDSGYFTAMNNTFDSGAMASTSYRNSKNFASNWISAGYSVWFLHESKYLSQPRLTLGTSCAVSGTGFFIASKVLEEAGGWKWHLLTEDIEFSTSSIINGLKIAYTPDAVLYDEQPTTFSASWKQRTRWSKGFYQVFGKYGGKLVKGIFASPKGHRFACYDMLMTIAPGMLLTIASAILNAIAAIMGAAGIMSTGAAFVSAASAFLTCTLGFLYIMLMFSIMTVFTEWDNIKATKAQKIKSVFTFPFFMATYIPIAIFALFKKPAWEPIAHTISVDVSEFAGTRQDSSLESPQLEVRYR